ncbi:MAG: endo-1,4-beta-xylanase [Pirellulales bacterium]
MLKIACPIAGDVARCAFIVCKHVLAIGLLLIPQWAAAQTLSPVSIKALAKEQGLKIGFAMTELDPFAPDPKLDTVFKSEASVTTLLAYWYLPDVSVFDAEKNGSPMVGIGFNSTTVTSPGGTKSIEITPKYSFKYQIECLKYAKARGIEVHGHNLIWAQDRFTPPWVVTLLKDRPDLAGSLIKKHCAAVVGAFKGDITTWHVINEAYNWDGKLLESVWSRTTGTGFIESAFSAAAAADPNAKLLYNDYGLEEADPRKFQSVMTLVRTLKSKKIPIHGIGWQFHTSTDTILDPKFDLEARMKAVQAEGLDNYITELDLTVPGAKLDAAGNPSAADLSRQAAAYRKVLEIFLRVKGISLQTWGVSDKKSWLGPKQFPLLFDSNYQPKPAYKELRKALGDLSGKHMLVHPATGKAMMVVNTATGPTLQTKSVVLNALPWPIGGDNPTVELVIEAPGVYRIVSDRSSVQPVSAAARSDVGLSTTITQQTVQRWRFKPTTGNLCTVSNESTSYGMRPSSYRLGIETAMFTTDSVWLVW